MAIYITKQNISFADGVHELEEAIELDTEAAQAHLGITAVDVKKLLELEAIVKQVIIEPVVFDLEITDPAVTDKPVKAVK